MDRGQGHRGNSENSYITPVNITFAIINAAVFFILSFTGDTQDGLFMYQYGAMYPQAVLDGEWYRLVTSGFLHFSLEHLFNNMLLLVCLGSYLEKEFGRIKYIIFYLASGVLSSTASMFYMLYSGDTAISAGASGIVFAMIGALLYLIIRNKGRFENLTIRRFLIMIILSLYFGFTSVGGNVDNAAHVGGLCSGFLLGILMYRKKKMHYH